MTTASPKSPVLVILPPTHQCADLGRVLKLARKAFDDLSLNILDLNLRFAWVSGDELQHGQEASPAPAMAALPATAAPAANQLAPIPAPTSFESPTAHSNVSSSCTQSLLPGVLPAHIDHPRVFISDLVPTLTDQQILSACTNGAAITGATFYPPMPLGPAQSPVRSVVLAFSKLKLARLHIEWFKQAASSGFLVGTIVTQAVSAHVLTCHASPDELIQLKATATAIVGGDLVLPFSADPASLASIPPATAVPKDLPNAQASAWQFKVGNLHESLMDKAMIASIIPHGIQLIGATLHPLKRSIKHRPEPVRAVSLAFQTEVEATLCGLWIKHHSQPGGIVAKMGVPWARISMSPSCKAPKFHAPTRFTTPSSSASHSSLTASSTHPISQSTAGAASRVLPSPKVDNTLMLALPAERVVTDSLDPLPQASPSWASTTLARNCIPPAPLSSLTSPSIRDLPEASPNHFRLHVSNLKPDLELAQIIPALVPSDVKLAGASLFAPRPMGGAYRELVRSLKCAFHTESDANRCQQWIKKDSGGGVSKLAPPGSKVAVGNLMLPMRPDAPAPAAQEQALTTARSPSALPTHGPTAPRAHSPARANLPASPSPAPQKQPHVSVYGIDSTQPVADVFNSILGSLLAGSVEPVRMGVRHANGRRGVEFTFDSEAAAEQFARQVWAGIEAGKYAEVTAEGEELWCG